MRVNLSSLTRHLKQNLCLHADSHKYVQMDSVSAAQWLYTGETSTQPLEMQFSIVQNLIAFCCQCYSSRLQQLEWNFLHFCGPVISIFSVKKLCEYFLGDGLMWDDDVMEFNLKMWQFHFSIAQWADVNLRNIKFALRSFPFHLSCKYNWHDFSSWCVTSQLIFYNTVTRPSGLFPIWRYPSNELTEKGNQRV